jgi:hypothetical protein
MATKSAEQSVGLQATVITWLMDSDPAIRWQVMRDLLGASVEQVAAERARVATEGWGAQLLALQRTDGSWGGVAWNHGYDSTMHVLTLLKDFGLEPGSPQAQAAVARVRDGVQWAGWEELGDISYFAGEVEPCINGQVAAAGAYFRQAVPRITERLLGEQLADGGWNCDAECGSTRSSFNTTICVLEALLEIERAFGAPEAVVKARQRGEEYLLERHLMRRKSTGETITQDRKGGTDWTNFAFPTWWHYDILRGLDYLRHAGAAPEERMRDALALVGSKRQADGRWLLDAAYPGTMLVDLGEAAGLPSRWNTLRALRVLKWSGQLAH